MYACRRGQANLTTGAGGTRAVRLYLTAFSAESSQSARAAGACPLRARPPYRFAVDLISLRVGNRHMDTPDSGRVLWIGRISQPSSAATCGAGLSPEYSSRCGRLVVVGDVF